ncbi:hypothetical protein MACK_001500 [Theileria orientalis]|uniref:Uncharacterized protein n=1 Tax=Theileria orientalis TaxID=68886 RepID=A0A976MCK8_THEOR|nr:hypothetical protein MACK_001500 [Theileria orientalis]
MRSPGNNVWNEINTSFLNPVPVYIDHPQETFCFNSNLVDNILTFKSKTGFAFNIVVEYINDKKIEIWKTDNKRFYSHKIEVDLIDNCSKAITIHFPENKSCVFIKYGVIYPWKKIDLSDVDPMSLNIQYPYHSYFFKNELVNDVRTFTAKKGFLFNNVREVETVIWSSSNVYRYANKVEYAKRPSKQLDLTIYLLNGKKKLFIKENDSDPWKELNISKVHPKSINIDYEHDSYVFDNDLQGNYRTFTAKTGFIFNSVVEYLGDTKVEIWKTDSQSEYSKKIEVDLINYNSRAVTVFFENNISKIFMKTAGNDCWTQLDTSRVDAKSLNIQYPYDTYFLSNKYENNVITFEAKKGDTKVEIWKTDSQSEYSKKIEVDLINYNSRAVTVFFENNISKIFMKTAGNDCWTQLDTSRVDAKSLNIQYPYDTYFLSNKYENNVITFEAKKGFLLNNVREVETVIWSSSNVYRYANKVEYAKRPSKQLDLTIYLLNGKKKLFIKENDSDPWKEIDISDVNTMDICIDNQQDSYLLNSDLQGNIRSFTDKTLYPGHQAHQGQLSDHPGQKPASESEELLYSDILLVTFDPDNNKTVKLDPNLYKAYDYENIIEYSLSQHATCIAIKHANKTVWKHNHEKYGDSYPVTIIHNKNTQKIYIHFKDFEIFFQRDLHGSWNASKFEISLFAQDTSDRRFIKELDISQYLLTKVEEKYQFLINQDVLCSEIHIDDKIIWKSGEFQLQNPFLVTFHEKLKEIAVGDCEKLLFYYKLNDSWPFYRTKYINGNRRPSNCKTARNRRLPCTSSSLYGSED